MKSAVLINSFAKMVQALQIRERELAMALSESRELASVTSESRRRVEAAHADLLATLETVPAALMIFNTDGSVRLRNRAATEVMGIEPQNPNLRENYCDRFKRIAKDGSVMARHRWISTRALSGEIIRNEELEIHHPDGRVFPILASGAPLRNELAHVAGAVVAFQDIAKMRAVDRMKDEFVSIVSHELRTPLTSIRGSVQLVLDEPQAVPDAVHRNLLQIALKAQLSSAGYTVLDARDDAAALHIARTSQRDVITVDLLMPGVDGWPFIDRLRQEPSIARIPIVIVSGAAEAKSNARLPIDVSVIAKGEGHDRLLREISLALAAIEHGKVDLLVLDLVMPNIDGFEVLAKLKELAIGSTIPVIVVTGTDRSSTELQALRLGANVYLTKPIEATALTEEVTRLLTSN